jgi:hypothetical protein
MAILILAAAVWLAEVVVTAVPSFNDHFTTFINIDTYKLLTLVPVFLVGSVIFLYRNQIPDSGWIAIGCLGLVLASFLIPVGGAYVGFALSRSDLSAPLLVYPVLWLGAHLPGGRICSRNDYSYGTYIYAFPVAQLLALWGAYHWGYIAYTSMTVVVTGVFAVGSWWLIEKRALKLKDISLPHLPRRPVPLVPVEDPTEYDVFGTTDRLGPTRQN